MTAGCEEIIHEAMKNHFSYTRPIPGLQVALSCPGRRCFHGFSRSINTFSCVVSATFLIQKDKMHTIRIRELHGCCLIPER